MGTRADYYLDRNGKLEWIGSSAYDGDPWNLPKICSAKTEKDYRSAVRARIRKKDGTLPKDGWPWPWEDSSLTDNAYVWRAGRTMACRNNFWFPADGPEPQDAESFDRAEFPDMSARANVQLGERSGLLFFFDPGT